MKLTRPQPLAEIRSLRSGAVGKNGTKDHLSELPGSATAIGNPGDSAASPTQTPAGEAPKVVSKTAYDKELARLQTELVRMQEWIVHRGLRVMVIFEGRDTAGKGGTIKRIMERLNARYCRVVALGTPTDRERSQWYFQRYIAHLPAAGEIVLFDRSWYTRAGVERVMEFCTEEEHAEFFRTCPQIERALVRSGIILVKYWLSLSDEEQERRFTERINNPGKRWKLSPMDLEARARWVDYAEAIPTLERHRGTWSTPTTRSRPGSTSSATFFRWSRTRKCRTRQSSFRTANSGRMSDPRSTARRGSRLDTWCDEQGGSPSCMPRRPMKA
jgi:polyphosphate kinase 2